MEYFLHSNHSFIKPFIHSFTHSLIPTLTHSDIKNMKPTESELEILQVLWANGPSTVRLVNEELNLHSEKSIGYTTTLKLMQLMLTKGFLERDARTRTHIYKSAVEERRVKQGLLSQFVDKAFRGSAAQLVMEALGQHRTSDDELAKIKALIEQMEDDKKDSHE